MFDIYDRTDTVICHCYITMSSENQIEKRAESESQFDVIALLKMLCHEQNKTYYSIVFCVPTCTIPG